MIRKDFFDLDLLQKITSSGEKKSTIKNVDIDEKISDLRRYLFCEKIKFLKGIKDDEK